MINYPKLLLQIFGLILITMLLAACDVSTISVVSTTTPTLKPSTPTFTPTPTSTFTPTPTPTVTTEPTATPEFLGEFSVENLVYTDFDNPKSATWALFNQTSRGFDTIQLEGTTIDVLVNGVSHVIFGEEAIQQIQQMGGILTDYNEAEFSSPNISVDIVIHGPDGNTVYDLENTTVPNWSEVGAIDFPLDCNTGKSILDDPTVIVYHYDDMDPGPNLYSSFEGFTFPSSKINQDTLQEQWVPGVEQGHGNAVDTGRIPSVNENTIQICAPNDYNISHIVTFDRSNGTEMSLQIDTNLSALVNFNGSFSTTPLHLGMNHVMNYDGNLPFIGLHPKDTPIGYFGFAGGKTPEIHLGIYSPNCYGANDCDPSRPTFDPNALILPFALFIPEEVYNQMLFLNDTSPVP